MMNFAADQINAKATMMAYRSMPSADVSEEKLASRFARSGKQPATITYEVANDIGLVHQYRLLRQDMGFSVWGMGQASAAKDAFDDSSEILVARIGNHCIAGVRLTFGQHLPMEQDGLTLAQEFPELSGGVAELSRLAMLPKYENGPVLYSLLRLAAERSAVRNVRFAVTLSPLAMARKAAALGIKSDVRTDLAIEGRDTQTGAKLVISVFDMASVPSRKTVRVRTAVPA